MPGWTWQVVESELEAGHNGGGHGAGVGVGFAISAELPQNAGERMHW